MWISKFTKFLFKNSQNLIYEFVDEHWTTSISLLGGNKMIFPVSKTVLSFTPKSSIRAIFRPKNYFVCFSKTMHWDTFVFSCFSLIFGCSLTVFSVHLDASPWNLEFFWFTRTSFFVHQKNSRFQGSASRFTEKTVSSQPKMQEKQKKTSGVSLHSFPGAYKIFFGRKMARKEQFLHKIQKKIFSKSGCFVSSDGGSFLAPGGQKTWKTLLRGPQIAY